MIFLGFYPTHPSIRQILIQTKNTTQIKKTAHKSQAVFIILRNDN